MEQVTWRVRIPGYPAVRALGIDPGRRSVYVADGWGVAYAALRLRRLDLGDGSELATVRLGNAARCIAFSHDSLLAATDTKLFRIDAETLEIVERWDRRVPRYADAIIATDDRLLLANWQNPRIALVHLGEWRVQRFVVGEDPLLLSLADGVALAYSRSDGSIARIDLTSESVRPEPVGKPGPCVDATIGDGLVWLLPGTFTTMTTSPGRVTIEQGPAAERLVAYDVDAAAIMHEATIEPARRIGFASARRELWTANDSVNVFRLPELIAVGHATLPRRHEVAEIFPEARIALTSAAIGEDRTELACVQVG